MLVITKYYIVYGDDGATLIINLDFNYEFSNFDFKVFSKNIKHEIMKIAHKMNANKVKIVVNGILLSTLLLSPISLDKEYNTKTFITNNTIKDNFKKISIEKNTNDDIILIDVSKPKKESNKKIENTKKNNMSNDVEDKKNEEVIKQDKKEPEITNSVLVTVNRSNGSIINLDLDEYLIGVVGSEMPASFNIEALKAQAIVARTYTLKRISEGKILSDNTSTQVYKDNDELKKMWKDGYDKYYTKVKNAVMSTKGMVLMYNNNYIDAVYHSTSNGMTEDAVYVWGYDIPYLKSVKSETDTKASTYERKVVFPLEKMSSLLNTNIKEDTNIYLERNTSHRVTNIIINDLKISGTTFRTLLGLRSTDFTIEIQKDYAYITTHGYGHGVGMSQYGANGLANLGFTYISILNHYYQNVLIKYIY